MSSYRQVLTHRVSGTLYVSSTVSMLGDWAGFAALMVLAVDRSEALIIGPAALFTAQGLAALVSTTVAGPWLDHVDRRLGIAGAYLAGAASISLPLFFDGIWPLYVAVALVGALRPIAAALRHATAGIDLPPTLLGPTIALEGATGQLVVALGLAVGSAIAVTINATTAIALDVATFTFAGIHALRLPSGRGGNSAQRSWSVGYRTMFSTIQARRLSLLLIASAVVGALPETLAPSGSHDALSGATLSSQNNPWLAWVVSAQALGTALASFAVGIGRRFEQPSGLMALTLGSGAMLLGGALAFDLNPGLLGLANLLFGMTFAFTITARTAFTRTIAPSVLGASVASAITLVMAGEAIGSLALAVVAEHLGAPAAYVTAAGLLLVTALVAAMMSGPKTAASARSAA